MTNRGMRDLMQRVKVELDAADKQFRASHTGMPVDVVIEDFAEFGPNLDLPDETLRAYAEAVSSGQPFEWELRA